MESSPSSGEKNPNGSSFIPPGSFRILLGFGFGLLSRRLWTTALSSESKLASLTAAPTLPLSSLNLHPISTDGHLVLLQNGVVSPLSSLPPLKDKHQHRLYSSSGREVVLMRTVEYTDQPKEFADVFEGNCEEQVSRVPFALVADENRDNSDCRSSDFFVIVNANEKHLPLERESSVKSRLNPPVFLTKRVTRRQRIRVKDHKARGNVKSMRDIGLDKFECDASGADHVSMATSESVRSEVKSGMEEEKGKKTDGDGEIMKEIELAASSLIRVNKVTQESVLGAGTRLENVFGTLKLVNNGLGFPEIEPCPLFPKKCFTMSKSEIKREVEVETNAFAMKACSFGVGLISFGLLFSGVRRRLSSTK